MKRLIITTMKHRETSFGVMALWEDGKIQNIRLEQKGPRLLGSIHVGKVQKVLPNIGGAFVEIKDRIPCYLPLSKNRNPVYTKNKTGNELKAGDELLVQVTQEALKTKAPCVSSNLSFTGNYLVLTTENHLIAASGKIPKKRGALLKEWISTQVPEDRRYGVVIRTNGKDASEEQLLSELHMLEDKMNATLKKGMFSNPHTMVMAGESAVLNGLKHIYWDSMEKVITDDPEAFQTVSGYLSSMGADKQCPVSFYEDKLLPLCKLYSLETVLEEALQEKVWLKSGGFLVIQQTEAFVSIDVNSGKQISKKTGDDQYFKINLEAGKEIARQLRLRNLYGMILIDFINMKDKENQSALLAAMRSYVKDDNVKTTVVDVTALGIMELTRQKEEKSLYEQFKAATMLLSSK